MFIIFRKHILGILIASFAITLFGLSFVLVSYAEEYSPQVRGTSDSAGQPVVIIDNGVKMTAYCSGETVEEIFNELGIKCWPEDKIKVFPDPALGIGTQITIRRATPVVIVDGLKTIRARTWSDTVAQVLKEKKIKVNDLDRINYEMDKELTNNIKIVVVRVKEEIVTKEEEINYKEITKEDDSLLIGKSYIEQYGEVGKKELKYKLTYENGKLAKKDLIKKIIIKEPKNHIIVIGTMRPYIGEGYASWYSYLPGSCAHRTLAIGTKILVRYGNKTAVCVVLDRGPFIGGRVIDLSSDVFQQLAPLGAGVIYVRLEKY